MERASLCAAVLERKKLIEQGIAQVGGAYTHVCIREARIPRKDLATKQRTRTHACALTDTHTRAGESKIPRPASSLRLSTIGAAASSEPSAASSSGEKVEHENYMEHEAASIKVGDRQPFLKSSLSSDSKIY